MLRHKGPEPQLTYLIDCVQLTCRVVELLFSKSEKEFFLLWICWWLTSIRYMATISKKAIDSAIKRLRQQGPTPFSPCSADNGGEVRLCAAAAVAAAGVELKLGQRARLSFEKALASSGDSEYVRQTYERLGWETSDCDRIFVYNNSLSDRERQDGVISFLQLWS